MRRKLLLIFLLAAAVFVVCLTGPQASLTEAAGSSVAPARLQVFVLDVGRGQSVLVISPVGRAALIDAGPSEAGSRVVSELRRRGVQKLELAVATQAGADYIGGMRRVASSSDIFIKSFVDSAQPWKTDAYQQMMAAVQSANIPVMAATRGQFFDLGGGTRLDIVNPAGGGKWIDPTEGESRENANSVVVRLLYREFVMLIMGGAGASTAAQMIEARQNIWAPFLVVGNGGARGSVSEKMLQVVQPKFAIISTGTSNAPSAETIELLKASKTEIYSTDASGEISITSDGHKHDIAKER